MDPRNFGSSHLLYLDLASCYHLTDLAFPATSPKGLLSVGMGELAFCEVSYDQQEQVNKSALAN